jgi:hypothetical protein
VNEERRAEYERRAAQGWAELQRRLTPGMSLTETLAIARQVADGATEREVLARLDEARRELVATGVGAGALGQGDQAPDFTLPDHLGRPVRLADLLAAGPVVLSFYRGRGARSATSSSPALGRYHDRIIALGATLVAVSPEPPDLAGSLVDRHSLAFPVLFGRRQRGGRLLPAGDDDP